MINIIKRALRNMDKGNCIVWQYDFRRYLRALHRIRDRKILERPFAYEFYHQMRLLGQKTTNAKIFGEVDKASEHLKFIRNIPDFIIHNHNMKRVDLRLNKNYAVIEIKVIDSVSKKKKKEIRKDIDKLLKFMKHPNLHYQHAVEIIIGEERFLEIVKHIMRSNQQGTYKIDIIYFNVDTWKLTNWIIKRK